MKSSSAFLSKRESQAKVFFFYLFSYLTLRCVPLLVPLCASSAFKNYFTETPLPSGVLNLYIVVIIICPLTLAFFLFERWLSWIESELLLFKLSLLFSVSCIFAFGELFVTGERGTTKLPAPLSDQYLWVIALNIFTIVSRPSENLSLFLK